MTDLKGNNEFCFPVTLSVPEERNIEGRGERKLTVYQRATHLSVLLYLPTQK